MNKNNIDQIAELEGKALRKQNKTYINKRVVLSRGSIYNKDKFDRLFRKG